MAMSQSFTSRRIRRKICGQKICGQTDGPGTLLEAVKKRPTCRSNARAIERLCPSLASPRPRWLRIRHNTHTGRPLRSADFLNAVESQTKRRLALQERGPKRAAKPGDSQGMFSFGA